MRAQYHFRPSPQGLCAWDVRRLVELSRNLERERIPLAAIRELDEAYWANDGKAMTCREVVNHTRLILSCDLSFPVILSSDGRVMDGMHRVARALMEGFDAIDAVRFLEDPEPDYIDMHPDALPYNDTDE